MFFTVTKVEFNNRKYFLISGNQTSEEEQCHPCGGMVVGAVSYNGKVYLSLIKEDGSFGNTTLDAEDIEKYSISPNELILTYNGGYMAQGFVESWSVFLLLKDEKIKQIKTSHTGLSGHYFDRNCEDNENSNITYCAKSHHLSGDNFNWKGRIHFSPPSSFIVNYYRSSPPTAQDSGSVPTGEPTEFMGTVKIVYKDETVEFAVVNPSRDLFSIMDSIMCGHCTE